MGKTWTECCKSRISFFVKVLSSNSGTATPVESTTSTTETATNPVADAIVAQLVETEKNRSQIPSESGTAIAQDIQLPAPQSGIYYKVQISATMKSPVRNNAWFSTKYKWQDNVDLAMQDGWKKYMIGTFNNYEQAKAFRNQTSEKISDAFVVAYDHGQRISVQEALKSNKSNQ